MEVKGQLQASADLTQVPIVQAVGGPKGQSGRSRVDRNIGIDKEIFVDTCQDLCGNYLLLNCRTSRYSQRKAQMQAA